MLDVQQMLQRYSDFTGKSVPELTKSAARIVAVSMANRTNPFSVGKDGGKKGRRQAQEKVARTINSVFSAQRRIEKIIDKTKDEKLAARLQRMADAGRWKELGKILYDMKLIQTPLEIIGLNKMEGIHSRYLKTRKKEGFYYAPKIETYIKRVQQRVGFTKAAWADVARKLNAVKGDGAKGIPAWAKKRKFGTFGKVIDRSKDLGNSNVTMTNTLNYSKEVLTDGAMRQALQDGRYRMLKMIKMAFAAAKKKGANMQAETKRITQSV